MFYDTFLLPRASQHGLFYFCPTPPHPSQHGLPAFAWSWIWTPRYHRPSQDVYFLSHTIEYDRGNCEVLRAHLLAQPF
jgi:hypothetical protein